MGIVTLREQFMSWIPWQSQPLLDVKNQGMLMDLPYPLIPNPFQTLLADRLV